MRAGATDFLVRGAGPVGCVIAERAARVLGWRVLVLDRRAHIAGNCYDETHAGTGVRVHRYGPHYIRFSDPALLAYVSTFTEWVPGNYIVRASVDGLLVPVPINLDTLELLYGVGPLDADSAAALLEREREHIEHPANSEEFVLSRVGRRLYEALYLGYTCKQWERHPRDLDPSVCGRIPVRLNRDPRYPDAPYQVMPRHGLTALFGSMLDHARIDVRLGEDWLVARPKGTRATVFTGPPDAYFGHRLGPLPWRSLEFEFREVDAPWAQPCVQINYPGAEPFTRTVEIKHVTRQVTERTVVAYEYPRAEGEPYYPIPAPDSRALYERYAALAAAETEAEAVYFAGRLATYRYINTDEAIAHALATVERLAARS